MGIAIATKQTIEAAVRARETDLAARGRPPGEPTPPPAPDDTLAKLVKLVPSEIVAFYLGISSFLIGSPDSYQFSVFMIGVVATPLVMWLSARPRPGATTLVVKPPPLQYVVRTAAFVLWATATAYPFLVFGKPLDPKIIGIALATFTLFAPFAFRE